MNRGIYHKGWTAVTRHSIPWTTGVTGPPMDEDVWELYEPGDWTQANDISAERPDQVRLTARNQSRLIAPQTNGHQLPLEFLPGRGEEGISSDDGHY